MGLFVGMIVGTIGTLIIVLIVWSYEDRQCGHENRINELWHEIHRLRGDIVQLREPKQTGKPPHILEKESAASN